MAVEVKIVEVSPRDGLQNEKTFIPTAAKLRLIRRLQESGLRWIELTSFVSPRWVPQLADAAELIHLLGKLSPQFSALVPNEKGLGRALESELDSIAVFTAASETFCRKNINMSQAESLQVFAQMVSSFRAVRPNGWIRAYVSTAFQCPYEGRISPDAVRKVTTKLFEMGVDEVSLGDTIGVAGPSEVKALLKALKNDFSMTQLALHFHDTNGTALANVMEGLDHGVRVFDSSAGGLGGCPYAPGAGGNLATEDLIYLLERERISTGVDLGILAQASLEVLDLLGRAPAAKAQVAQLSRANADSCAT